jgi:ABC-2 type transport system ATP-binding protein
MNVIETKGLTKYYGKSRGIIDVNLSVDEGDVFGFIGPNGAGKSTTIRTLLGLISPTKGSGTIFGMDITKDTGKILRRVGYMPSEAMFYPGMRVDETIKLAADLRKKDCSREAKALCERLQLSPSKKIEELSLGNRKKVSIVCAMQHEPDLYIFDEPTSGLDPLMQQEFFRLIKEKNDKNATVFLSSHVLGEIQKYCIHAGIVKDGKLIMVNTVEEMSKSTAKQIVVHGIENLPAISGIVNVEKSEDHISFMYQGEIPLLISALNQLPITNLTITDPDLEDIFMHFYKEAE